MAIIKEKYDVLKKKQNLPDFPDINMEFDLEEISAESELLSQKIRERMHEKIDFYAKLIEAILQPESTLSDMYEAHYLNDKEKNSAYVLFKKLKRLLRYSHAVALDNTEDNNLQFIKEAWKEWQKSKGEIKRHITRLIGLWEKETDIKEDLSYFG